MSIVICMDKYKERDKKYSKEYYKKLKSSGFKNYSIKSTPDIIEKVKLYYHSLIGYSKWKYVEYTA